jgi:xanthine/uracil permease
MRNGKKAKGWVLYPIGSRPRIGLAMLLGIHHYLTMFGSTILIPYIMGGAMKLPQEELALLISTMFFASGITTLFQVSRIGSNLPVVQGGQFSFLAPSLSIIAMVAVQNLGWKVMIQQVSAAIMFASAFEIILGYTGAMIHAKRFIGPIVIGPVIAMIGFSLFGFGARWMAGNWTISLITLLALILYSQVFSRKSRAFLMFPVILAIATGWLASLVGTLTGWIAPDNAAHLAGKLDLIRTSPWFWIRPAIPFKWGFPQLNGITVAGAFGMLAGYVSSMIESIGDYHSVCRMAEAPAPTSRMISKGLGSEGLGCLVDGLLQTCNGTTSYSENISAIGLTRVAARSVMRWSAVLMLVLPLLGKFGAVMAALPLPVIGAMLVGLFGLIAAVGISNLQFVNLNNARNLFIIGIGLFAGLSVPPHFYATPINFASAGKAAEVLGNILQAILSTGIADTAIVTALLDNLLPGATREERGLAVWESAASEEAWAKAEAEWKKMAVGAERKIVLK